MPAGPDAQHLMPSSLEPKSVAVVLGTRPELIKLSPLIRRLGDAAHLIHTGQHYDHQLSPAFLDELGLPAPSLQLGVGAMTRGVQVGTVVTALDHTFREHRPRAVVVQGDTNAVLAGSIAANASEVPLVHVEAGLRSHDRRMPEEHNRVVADHLADMCLAPTELNVANLASEGIPGDRVALTGNTVVEAVESLLPDARGIGRVVAAHDLEPDRFVLATLHRPENVDDHETLARILGELAAVDAPVLLPMHPRTARRVADAGLSERLGGVRVIDPLGHREFLALMSASAVVVSDSGGVQEEVTIVKRPAVIVRRSTERPEALGDFTELVRPGPDVGGAVRRLLGDVDATRARLASIPSPYGDGDASRRSLEAIERLVGAV